MLKVSMHFFGTDIRRHGNDRDCRVILPDIHGRRNTIQTGHDNVHKDKVEMVPGHIIQTLVSLDTVALQGMISTETTFDRSERNSPHVRPHIPSTSRTSYQSWRIPSHLQQGKHGVSVIPRGSRTYWY